jgi:hypothetical protein
MVWGNRRGTNPEKICACMGGRPTDISRRSVARAGARPLMSLLAWPGHAHWGARRGVFAVACAVGVFARVLGTRRRPPAARRGDSALAAEPHLPLPPRQTTFAGTIWGPASRWRKDCAVLMARDTT